MPPSCVSTIICSFKVTVPLFDLLLPTMYCPKCGTESVMDDAAFCYRCGHDLRDIRFPLGNVIGGDKAGRDMVGKDRISAGDMTDVNNAAFGEGSSVTSETVEHKSIEASRLPGKEISILWGLFKYKTFVSVSSSIVLLVLVVSGIVYRGIVHSPIQLTILEPVTPNANSDTTVIVNFARGRSLALGPGDEATVREGDTVIAWSSGVLIQYADGWKSTLQANSILDIEQFSKRQQAVGIELHLRDGEIDTSINRDLGYTGNIRVRTRSATVEAVGTQFLVRTNSTASSYVAVYSGSVKVSTNSDEVTTGAMEHARVTTGEKIEVEPLTDFPFSVDSASPYIIATRGGVYLRAGPSAEAHSMAQLALADRMRLLGQSDNEEWYLVCCIKGERLSWVSREDVSTHSIYSPLPRYPDGYLEQAQIANPSSPDDVNAQDSNEERVEQSTSTPTMTPSPTRTSMTVPTLTPTKELPLTSTPISVVPPTREERVTEKARPIPPFVRPLFPQLGDFLVAEPASSNDQEVGDSSPIIIAPAPTQSVGEDVVSDEVVETSAANPLSDGVDPETTPTKTPFKTRKPNTSTSTPVPPAPATTSTPIVDTATQIPTPIPTTDEPTNTPTPTNTPAPPTNTPR